MSNDVDYVFKIVAVGTGGVGKTSLIRRFASGKFESNYLMTLGVDFTTKSLTVNNKNIKIVCADTAGQVYYGNIRPQYYEGAYGAIIMFDLTNRNSYDSVEKWIEELQLYIKDVPMIIVGNKLDLTIDNKSARRVETDEADQFSKSRNMKYLETSAKTAENVESVFSHLAEEILKEC